MNKDNLDLFFSSADKKDFCVIVIENKDILGNFSSEDMLKQYMEACKNLFEASFLTYHTEMILKRIVCYLNYDKEYFSIRALVGSLRQVLFSMNTSCSSYLFYSDSFNTSTDLLDELDFIFENLHFDMLVSRKSPVPSAFLHLCSEKTIKFEHDSIYSLLSMLEHHRFEEFSDTMLQKSDTILKYTNTAATYALHDVLDYTSELFYSIKIFFEEHNFKCDIFDRNLIEALYFCDGIVGLIAALSEQVVKYSDTFKDVAVSDRKKQHINEMLNYIEENISTVSLKDLSTHFDLTSAYICRLFKEEYHMNFTDYLKKKKFSIALSELQSDSEITIAKICEKLGYQSQSYFQNLFKKEMGMTPNAYRMQYHRLNSER